MGSTSTISSELPRRMVMMVVVVSPVVVVAGEEARVRLDPTLMAGMGQRVLYLPAVGARGRGAGAGITSSKNITISNTMGIW